MLEIKLNCLDEINNFLSIIQECKNKVTILLDTIAVDAKSTLSVLSLDFNNPLLLHFENDEDHKLVEKWELLR